MVWFYIPLPWSLKKNIGFFRTWWKSESLRSEPRDGDKIATTGIGRILLLQISQSLTSMIHIFKLYEITHVYHSIRLVQSCKICSHLFLKFCSSNIRLSCGWETEIVTPTGSQLQTPPSESLQILTLKKRMEKKMYPK